VQIGAEDRNKLIAAISLGTVAVVLLVWEFGGWFGGSSTRAATPPPPRSSLVQGSANRSPARSRNPSGKKDAVLRTLDPSLRYDLLEASEDTKYEGTGRNIFRVFVEPPPRVITPVVTTADEVAQGPPPPPPPPPIKLHFYGFATPEGGAKRIFLSQGEDVFIAKEGDIVDRRYKVVRISPNSVEILDVLSNNRQSIPLIQG
jgi:hypothetical protein